jgi:hypothetical protein
MMNYEQDLGPSPQEQRSNAWLAVYTALEKHALEYMQNDSGICGRELAVKAIKDMAETIKVQQIAIKYLNECVMVLTK